MVMSMFAGGAETSPERSLHRPRHPLPLGPAGQVKQPAAVAAVVAERNSGLAGGQHGLLLAAVAGLAVTDAEAGAHGASRLSPQARKPRCPD